MSVNNRRMPQKLWDDVTLGSLQKRNKIFKKFIKNQLAPHRQASGEKTVLVSPFETKWPKIKRDVQQSLIEKIKTALAPMRREEERGGRKKREKEEEETTTGDDFTDSLRREERNIKVRKRDEIRKCMVFGINEATRRLERGELSCIVVCSSTAAICPTNHLQVLAATRQCPAVLIRDFSLHVGRSVGMNSMLVMAIKKSPPAPNVEWIGELVKVITESALPLHIQWVQFDETDETEKDEAEKFNTPTGSKLEHNNDYRAMKTASASIDGAITAVSKPTDDSSKRETFDINSVYIKKADSDWLKDEAKIVPVIRGTKSVVAQDFIKLDDSRPSKETVANMENPFIVGDSEEPPSKKKKNSSVGYLPPHVLRVSRDENRKKRLEKRKMKAKKS